MASRSNPRLLLGMEGCPLWVPLGVAASSGRDREFLMTIEPMVLSRVR
jgi:hypothetical protein